MSAPTREMYVESEGGAVAQIVHRGQALVRAQARLGQDLTVSDGFRSVPRMLMDYPFRPMLAMESRVKFHGVIPSTRFFRLA